MKTQTEDYSIECADGQVTVAGVLRLHSPMAYESAFAVIRDRLAAAVATFTIDIRQVKFMNSSGITALSRLVLQARARDTALVFVGAAEIPWHRKTLTSLKRLYDRLEVELN